MEIFFGNMTLVLAVAMVFVGLTGQIRKNYREKKCGMSFWLIVLALGVYTSRVGYAITINSLYIFIPDAFGVLFSIVLTIQFFLYRGNHHPA